MTYKHFFHSIQLLSLSFIVYRMKIITRTIWILSIISMLADMASEMLYPIIPVYLKEIGFSIIYIGLLEGIAEVTVGMTKGYFGKRSDQLGKRLPFIKVGYLLSALSKPMMAIFTYPLWILLARVTDRLGKGIRTAPRDALLAEESIPTTRARVFGFHRAWDTVGAVIGPLFALIYLQYYPGEYAKMFFIAFIPGLFSVATIFLLKEKKRSPTLSVGRPGFFSYFSYWPQSDRSYRHAVTGLLIFALANSSDVFLLLKAKDITGNDSVTISAYIFYNLVYAVSSYPLGRLADRIGMKKVLLAGMILFALVYAGFAYNTSIAGVYALFFLYGIYAASTEGISKALLSNVSKAGETATALGLFNSLQSLALFAASSIAGLLWAWQGSNVLFAFSAATALVAAMVLRKLH